MNQHPNYEKCLKIQNNNMYLPNTIWPLAKKGLTHMAMFHYGFKIEKQYHLCMVIGHIPH